MNSLLQKSMRGQCSWLRKRLQSNHNELNLSNSVYPRLEIFMVSHVDRVETEQDETEQGGGAYRQFHFHWRHSRRSWDMGRVIQSRQAFTEIGCRH